MARKPKSRRSVDEIEIDQRIGRRIRERRVVLGLNQTKLADGLGVSFQQLHNYEDGSSRIGAGRLYDCAQLLDVPPEYFFEGLERSDRTPEDMKSDEAFKLARAYRRISDPEMRQRVRQLAQVIARQISTSPRSSRVGAVQCPKLDVKPT